MENKTSQQKDSESEEDDRPVRPMQQHNVFNGPIQRNDPYSEEDDRPVRPL